MKTLNNYIEEALINKNTKLNTNDIKILDKSFDSPEELIEALNLYFSSRIKKPIKLINKATVFSIPKQTSSSEVEKYFKIEIEKTISDKYIIRFGVLKGSGRLISQLIKIINGKYTYCDFRGYYRFNHNENFLEWLNSVYSPNSNFINILYNK